VLGHFKIDWKGKPMYCIIYSAYNSDNWKVSDTIYPNRVAALSAARDMADSNQYGRVAVRKIVDEL
jgi:hypothetical protein